MLTFEEMKKNVNILLVDDDEDYIDLVKMYFGSLEYNIDVVSSGEEAIEIVKKEKHQIILLDYFMPGMSGEDVVNEIRKFNQQVIIIMQTGFAGQKPPIDTMKRLNIQNFHDKTEGIEKLNLEVISAVKIFEQQNAISVAKFKANAISKLITSIATNIKSSLMSVSGSIELTNMLVGSDISQSDIDKLTTFYEQNKKNLEGVDRILTTVINEVNNDKLSVMADKEIIEVITAILSNELREKSIELSTSISLRTNSYISGSITDIIFIICEIILRIANTGTKENINLVLTEDENNWYFKISNSDILKIDSNKLYIIKSVLVSVEDASIEINNDSAIISVIKK